MACRGDAGRIVGAVVGAAYYSGDFLLVRWISRRANGAEGPEHLLNHFIAGDCGRGRADTLRGAPPARAALLMCSPLLTSSR